MLKLVLILIGFLSFLTLHAQQVTNIRVTQKGDNVAITYDITSNNSGQTFDIKVECSTDNGKTFSIKPKSLTGDFKGIKAGNGKRIVWDVLSERETLSGDQFVFQLVAIDPYSGNFGTFTDSRDGQVYKWVKIGNQIWMDENLRTTKYTDGTNIPDVTDHEAWSKLKTPGYCWYNNEINNGNTYGALYNWYTIHTDKLAPTGWHVSTDAEWTVLVHYLGFFKRINGPRDEGDSFNKPNTGAKNESGFIHNMGGVRISMGLLNENDIPIDFFNMGKVGFFWTTSEGKYQGDIIYWTIFSDMDWTKSSDKNIIMNRSSGGGKEGGKSVRCVRD